MQLLCLQSLLLLRHVDIHVTEVVDEVSDLHVAHIRLCREVALRVIERAGCPVLEAEDLLCLLKVLELLVGVFFRPSCLDEGIELRVAVEGTLGARCRAVEEGVEGKEGVLEDHVPGEDGGLEVAVAPAVGPDAGVKDIHIERDASLGEIVLAGYGYRLL